MTPDEYENTLFYGDCLRIMSEILPTGSVDLIYLDPPFNSKKNYNMNTGGQAQITVFSDTWKWTNQQVDDLNFIAGQDVALRKAIDHLIDYVSEVMGEKSGLRAYLVYMAARLLACRNVLKETGSIYLHCDPTAGHYLKILMDAVFKARNFRNDIIWAYKSRPQSKKYFGRKHDNLLFYAKSEDHCGFNWEDVARPLSASTISKYRSTDENGRKYRLQGRGITGSPIRSAKDVNPQWEIDHPELVVRDYLDEKVGVAREDWWVDIDQLNQNADERRGLDTQKPIDLLKRIILASSNADELVLDPFCGCGTAVEAAQELGRRWIGIDVEPLSVDEMANRLRENCGIDPMIRGIPYNFDQARRLASTAPFEFERWALRLIPGAKPNLRQVDDKGLDGQAYIDLSDEKGKQPLFGFQVKGGATVGRPALDAFAGALQKNRCSAGLFVVLEEKTANRLRSSLATQDQITFDGWTGGHIGVWSVEDWFIRGEVCFAPVPPLVGASATIGLLKSRDWQRGLNMPKR